MTRQGSGQVPAGFRAEDGWPSLPASVAVAYEAEASFDAAQDERAAPRNEFLIGDVREVLRTLPDECVQTVITSPPYWSLRDYKVDGSVWGGEPSCEHLWSIKANRQGSNYSGESRTKWQHVAHQATGKIRDLEPSAWGHPEVGDGAYCAHCGAWRGALGLEPTPELFVEHIVEVMREVRRVLRKDGTAWLNLGDCYSAASTHAGGNKLGPLDSAASTKAERQYRSDGLKPKDLVGIPWRVAFALQADGWWLRSAFPWVKRASMPESVTDRPSTALEYIFMLSKSERYFCDMESVRKALAPSSNAHPAGNKRRGAAADAYGNSGNHVARGFPYESDETRGRNFRNADLWWESIDPPHGIVGVEDELVGLDVNTRPFSEAHFATFPERMVAPLLRMGTSDRGACVECGAPWRRVVERSASPHDASTDSAYEDGSQANRIALARPAARERGEEYAQTVRTVGWAPTCRCYDAAMWSLPRTKDAKRRRAQDATRSWRPRAVRQAWRAPEVKVAETQPCIVLDPFMGSGTVAIAALNAVPRRDYLGIELSAAYVEMAERRLEPYRGRLL